MWMADAFPDYRLIDTGDGQKLEQWGDYLLSRPEPQAVWPRQNPAAWQHCHAIYHRSEKGGGEWETIKPLPDSWQVHYGALTFLVRPTGFKHTGLFPEQAVNWDFMSTRIQSRVQEGQAVNVLNLFAYTGGATMACAKAGASVCHVDAAKGMVAWAKENAALCGLSQAPIRYLVDDALKFVRREARRGNRYQGILMDPPSYGRGPDGEMFRFETHVYPLIEACKEILAEDALFFLLNSYTAGFAPQVAQNVLTAALPKGRVTADNIGIKSESGLHLPCGATARWQP
ncbi:class I SAM-dependent methyltransferase [Eubacteriales bacterium OttesenSCG-928-M02]|nr:class I SAM-dependent methyltransferase [Eubacteriales bacterium OttesenSCG-928-M02]